MSRVLIVDDNVRKKVKDLIELATAQPYSLEQLKELAKGFDPGKPETRPEKDKRINIDFTMDIPMGYVVTYTHEHQPDGLYRHLSVSVPAEKAYPNPAAVQEIMKLFGFVGKFTMFGGKAGGLFVWDEAYQQGFHAINVMERVKA